MRDEAFKLFIEEFGEATCRRDVPPESISKWRGKLPDKLLEYWANEGWASYQNGLFSIVDPDDYEDIVDDWLEDSPFESIDSYHAIAKSAFGCLYLCGEKTGKNITISSVFNTIIASVKEMKPKNTQYFDLDINSFFVTSSIDSFDMDDSNGNSLFQQALQKLGPLAENEIYGFVPALVMGGTLEIQHIQKLDASIHLSILRQFATPEIFEI